jgi:heavy metal sensor kinase
MLFERVKTFCQTLRFRLTLWNTVLVIIMLLVNLVAIREGVRWTISRMVDEFITEELILADDTVRRFGGRLGDLHDDLNRQATSHPRRHLFIQLLDGRGGVAWSSDQSPAPSLLPASVLAFRAPVTNGENRVVCREVSVPGRAGVIVRVGCSLKRAELEMGRFTNMLLEVALFLLLAAPVGGYVLARRATRPIAQIISTTTRLNPAHLRERLPIRGTRDELDRLSQTINSLLDRIAEYLRQNREFTANAAHELRSPLTALQSSLEIALNADRTTEEYKEVLSVLLEECEQMRVLVNQLLVLAEGDAGRLRLHSRPVRLDQLAARSLEMFRAVAEAGGVELSIARLEPAEIHGDGSRLWQVVNNLIDNAVKFTPAGGRVTLALAFEGGGQRCVFEVTDTGVGISARDLPHVFERFYQGDKARDRETPARGLGLGLSICQAVVAAHGGTVEAVSAQGRGATFRVQFPDCTRPGATDLPPAAPAADPNREDVTAPRRPS